MKLRKLAEVCNYFDGVIGGVEVYVEHEQMFFELPDALKFTEEDLEHLSDKYGLFVETCENDDEHVKVFAMFV